MNVADTDGFARLLDLKIERRPTVQQWPNPEESTGTWYCQIGKCQCWDVRGPAREQYLSLAVEIKEHLEQHGEAVTSTVIWLAYMIGRSAESANPTVFFCCRESGARKRVRREIDDSGILSRYPGFRTGDSSRPPHLEQLKRLAGGESSLLRPSTWPASVCSNPIGNSIRVLYASNGRGSRISGDDMPPPYSAVSSKTATPVARPFAEPSADSHTQASRGTGEDNVVLAWTTPVEQTLSLRTANDRTVESHASENIRPATVGAVLRSGTTMYFTTVAHAFTYVEGAMNYPDEEDEVLEFDFEDESEEGAAAKEDVAASSPGTTGHGFQEALKSPKEDAHELTYVGSAQSGRNGPFRSKDIIFSSLTGSYPYLDYCLVELKQDDDRIFAPKSANSGGCDYHTALPKAISSPVPHDAPVVAYTGSRQARGGSLSGTPIFMTLQGGQTSQELWSVQLDGALCDGDCGSIVVNEKTGDLEGHIVAGSTSTGLALVVPAYQMLNDLRQRFRRDIQLPQSYSERRLLTPSEITAQFRDQLSLTRRRKLTAYRRRLGQRHKHAKALGSHEPRTELVIRLLPVMPRPPLIESAVGFAQTLDKIAKIPMRWESSVSLDHALKWIPLEQLHDEADIMSQVLQMDAMSTDGSTRPAWGLHDCFIQAMMKWFKNDFFDYLDTPHCPLCDEMTVSAKDVGANQDETFEDEAYHVELFKCPHCGTHERLRRWNDPVTLLWTKNGRDVEWANCFGLLCRAVGSQVRYVWSAEGPVWLEVYSAHREQWIHVDVYSGVWNTPLLYTEDEHISISVSDFHRRLTHLADRQQNMTYCIAFSAHSAKDVTPRYLRSNAHAGERRNIAEDELLFVLRLIQEMKRENLSAGRKLELKSGDLAEDQELLGFIAERAANDLCKAAKDLGIGPSDAREVTAEASSAPVVSKVRSELERGRGEVRLRDDPSSSGPRDG